MSQITCLSHVSRHPGQVTSPPVSDAVPGELSHDENQEDDLETNDPDHGVSADAVTGTHLRGVLSGTHKSGK